MQTPGRKGLALTDRGSHLRLWLTVGLGVALDLASKYVGWSLLGGTLDEGGREVILLPGWLRLVASRNPGIVFGINFSDDLGLGPAAGRAITILLTAVTSALILYVFAMAPRRQRWVHFWCGLILAGAMGNLFDRVVFGCVRDLIQITGHVAIGGWVLDWPYVFNVADVYLVVGVMALATTFLLAPPAGKAKGEAKPSGKEA